MLLNSSALNAALLNDTGVSSTSGGGGGGAGGFGATFTRFVRTDELARITEGITYDVFAQIKIADAAGVMQNYRSRNGINWIHSLEYAGNIDAPIGTATVRLWRSVGGRSLAPLKTDSSYNSDGPSIDSGRRISIDTASMVPGFLPADSDWRPVFEGYIDSVDWSQNPIVIECRDLGAPLADTWFPVPNTLPDSGLTIQETINLLLDLLHLDTWVTIYTPIAPDPAVLIGAFRYDIEAGIDVLQRLVQVIGWDLRYRWSDFDQSWRLTFKDPGRTRFSSDYTLTAAMYIDVKQLKVDRTFIRNDVAIWYGPDGSRALVTDYSPTSVNRYGRRSMVLQEASDSPIQTEADALLMAQLIVYDLAEPFADKIVEMPYFWPAELHNVITFPANLVHADTSLDLAVVAYKHVLDQQQTRTTLTLRGKPAGSYWQWLGRRPITPGGSTPVNPDGDPPGANGFATLQQTPNYAADLIQFDWGFIGDAAATFEIFAQRGAGGGFASAGTTGVGVYTFSFDPGSDIEPFITGTEIPVEISFYVTAIVDSAVVATSRTSVERYALAIP